MSAISWEEQVNDDMRQMKGSFSKSTCVDPEGGQGGPDHPPPPLKNYKNIGFLSNACTDPLKNHSYKASIQYLAIIGPAAKRHLIGVSPVGR